MGVAGRGRGYRSDDTRIGLGASSWQVRVTTCRPLAGATQHSCLTMGSSDSPGPRIWRCYDDAERGD